MTVPYVVGQWVRGERFYGRSALLDTLLRSCRPCAWVAGTRRIGKTSLLRQLELLADPVKWVPVVWDLQGVVDADELRLSLSDAVLDARGHDGLAPPEPDEDVAAYLVRLARALAAAGRTLLLLCDEAEDLAALLGREPGAAGRLVATLTASPGLRVVMASSVRLAALAAQTEAGAALLARLEPPVYLGPLDPAASRALVRQEHLPAAERPALDDAVVEAICERCGGHPFLLQLLAKRVLEGGDVDGACESLAADPMVAYLVAADLALLEEGDRALLRTLPAAGEAEPARAARLEALGLACRDAGGRLTGGNWFFGKQWAIRS